MSIKRCQLSIKERICSTSHQHGSVQSGAVWRGSRRVVDLDELMLQAQRARDVPCDRRGAVALGSMVASRDEAHPHLTREVRLWFRDLTRNERICARRNG